MHYQREGMMATCIGPARRILPLHQPDTQADEKQSDVVRLHKVRMSARLYWIGVREAVGKGKHIMVNLERQDRKVVHGLQTGISDIVYILLANSIWISKEFQCLEFFFSFAMSFVTKTSDPEIVPIATIAGLQSTLCRLIGRYSIIAPDRPMTPS